MKVSVNYSDGTLVLRVSGDVRIWGKEPDQEQLLNLLRAQYPVPTLVILNLGEIHQLDTAGVGALARVLIECSKRAIELKVVLPGGFPGQVLKRLHIFDAWPAYPNESAAAAASG